jgi:hypothetical protein
LALTEGITGSFRALNARISQLTGGLDLKILVPLTLIFFGLRGLWQSEKITAPPWFTLLWSGFASFVMLNRGLMEGTAKTAGKKKA